MGNTLVLSFFLLYTLISPGGNSMHQSRKTHNKHYETQKRLEYAYQYSNWNKAPRLRNHKEEGFYYKENNHSRRWVKKYCNKTLRKHDIVNETNIVNAKVLAKIYDRWAFYD